MARWNTVDRTKLKHLILGYTRHKGVVVSIRNRNRIKLNGFKIFFETEEHTTVLFSLFEDFMTISNLFNIAGQNSVFFCKSSPVLANIRSSLYNHLRGFRDL